ncbi:hypothetical protein ACQUEF_03540 [Vagococcus fluvialis]|uniref:hypothetical protein n=1 Tax=Vagococcus fluvialis TaxID=2738 RepID=UPI003D0D7762
MYKIIRENYIEKPIIEKVSDKLIKEAEMESTLNSYTLKDYIDGKDPFYFRYILKKEQENTDLILEIKELNNKIDSLKGKVKKADFVSGVYVCDGEGPFCTTCYDKEGKKIRLIRNTLSKKMYWGIVLSIVQLIVLIVAATTIIGSTTYLFIDLFKVVFVSAVTLLPTLFYVTYIYRQGKSMEEVRKKCPVCDNKFIVNYEKVHVELKKQRTDINRKKNSKNVMQLHENFKYKLDKVVILSEKTINCPNYDFSDLKEIIEDINKESKEVLALSNKISRKTPN